MFVVILSSRMNDIRDLFFFQAEDGIRDLVVRSRGLGDVYKRQEYESSYGFDFIKNKNCIVLTSTIEQNLNKLLLICPKNPDAVSYTHLTLPTSDLV